MWGNYIQNQRKRTVLITSFNRHLQTRNRDYEPLIKTWQVLSNLINLPGLPWRPWFSKPLGSGSAGAHQSLAEAWWLSLPKPHQSLCRSPTLNNLLSISNGIRQSSGLAECPPVGKPVDRCWAAKNNFRINFHSASAWNRKRPGTNRCRHPAPPAEAACHFLRHPGWRYCQADLAAFCSIQLSFPDGLNWGRHS